MNPVSPHHLKVLIVDDSKTVRQQLRIAMSVIGLTCIEAVDGIEAWSQLQLNPKVDLAIIDIQMPRLNGLELAERIRASERHQRMPFLMCSSLSPQEVQRSREVGARGWIVKPFEPKRLIIAVCKVLDIPAPDSRMLLDKATPLDTASL